MSRCEKCVAPKANPNKNICLECRDNPVVQRILMTLPRSSHFLYYIAVCPRGFADCIYDPAYIKFHYPDWYKELYGDKTPYEAAEKCRVRVKEDPTMEYYCYDDEDK